MASELAEKQAEILRRKFDAPRAEPWTRKYQMKLIADAIDRAIRASHAQRTRRENEALDGLTFSDGFNSDKVALVKRALQRARRGSK